MHLKSLIDLMRANLLVCKNAYNFLATTRLPRLNEILGPAPTVWLDRRAGRLRDQVHTLPELGSAHRHLHSS
jgi:hypothetical protein